MKKYKKISIEKFQLKATPISADKAKNITGGRVGSIFPCGS